MRLNSVLYAAVVLTLTASSPVVAQNQNMSDYQKQMMNKLRQQYQQDVQTGQKQPPVTVPGELATQGKAIFNDPALGTNGKSCGNCHAEGKNPLDGRQPDNYLVAYVQYCYEHALNGQGVIDKGKLDKLMAYFMSIHQQNSHSSPTSVMPSIPAPKTEEKW